MDNFYPLAFTSGIFVDAAVEKTNRSLSVFPKSLNF